MVEQLLLPPPHPTLASTSPCLLRPTDLSPPSSPSTLSLPSTSPRTSGSSSRESRPRPPASPSSRPSRAPLSSTTSTAASTLVTGTPTRTLPPHRCNHCYILRILYSL